MLEEDLQTLERYRGDTVPNVVKFRLPNGLPRNVTGYSQFVMTVNAERTPNTALRQVMKMDGVVTNAWGGVVAFKPTPDVSNNLSPGRYYFDIQAIDNNGDTVTLGDGRYVVKQDISK